MHEYICLVCGYSADVSARENCPQCQCSCWAEIKPERRYSVLLERLCQILDEAASPQEATDVILKAVTIATRGASGSVWELTPQSRWTMCSRFSFAGDAEYRRHDAIIDVYESHCKQRDCIVLNDANNPIAKDVVFQAWDFETTRVVAIVHEPRSFEYLQGSLRFMRHTFLIAEKSHWFQVK